MGEPRTSGIASAIEALWPGYCLPALRADARLTLDSRQVGEGDVFVALPGTRCDGRDFIDNARAQGAALTLAAPPFESAYPDVLVPEGLAEQLGVLAALAFGVSGTLEQIAVTGTNGKSSVTHYIASLSEALGTPCALIGTLGCGRPGALRDADLTTPDPISLQARLRDLGDAGACRVALEASSHALDQNRLSGCRIRAGVFTNLSRDHLDYHPGMAAYAAAKARLFHRPEMEVAVVNGDDPLARLMLAGLDASARVVRVGDDASNDFRVLRWQGHPEGIEARLVTPEGERDIALSLLGRFNLDNVLLAIATLYALGTPLDALLKAAQALSPVPGRMQRLSAPGAPTVVVDYAHTPDALGSALMALREHVPGRLWCLFGCGGERDPGKRALMGEIASLMADRVVVTDDNPRTEPAADIRRAILDGCRDAGVEAVFEKVLEIPGRADAIACTLAEADPGDVILLAGKGHETWQEINGVRHAFSDVEIAGRALLERAHG